MLREGWHIQGQNKHTYLGVCETPAWLKARSWQGKEQMRLVREGWDSKTALDSRVSWTLPAEDAWILSNDKSHANKHLMLLITPSSLKHFLPLDSRMPCSLLSLLPHCLVSFVPPPLPLLQHLECPRAQAWFLWPFPEALFPPPAACFIQCHAFKHHLCADNSQLYISRPNLSSELPAHIFKLPDITGMSIWLTGSSNLKW